MNGSLFIARRIIKGGASNRYSKTVIRFAVGSIAVGLAVMIISVSVVIGFKKAIQNKVAGFGAHIQISKFDENESLESTPINKAQTFYPYLSKLKGVRHIQVFALKAGLIRTTDDIGGVVLKGIGSDFDWSFFNKNIKAGRAFKVKEGLVGDEMMLSSTIASKLKLKVGDPVVVWFIQDPPRVRKFKLVGIYETGLEDFDKMLVLADIGQIQKLNDWKNSQVGGFEVLIDDFKDMDRIGKEVYENIGYDLNARTIKEIYPQIFDWLELQNVNAQIIILLMIIVAAINMISAVLILILERTSMIGLLKALGSGNWMIRKVFLYNAGYLIIKGLIWGNLLGLGLCLLQYYTGVFALPQESYYVKQVPVDINLMYVLILNIGTLLTCLLMLVLPTMLVSRISPIKAIRMH